MKKPHSQSEWGFAGSSYLLAALIFFIKRDLRRAALLR
ncbi:MAG: hypothetical protein RLY87_302 [Chloroflexota bacterium]|jgi:hypothetical protein